MRDSRRRAAHRRPRCDGRLSRHGPGLLHVGFGGGGTSLAADAMVSAAWAGGTTRQILPSDERTGAPICGDLTASLMADRSVELPSDGRAVRLGKGGWRHLADASQHMSQTSNPARPVE